MNSKSIGADLAFAWPSAEIAVMGAPGAVNIIFRKEIETADDPRRKRAELIEEYDERFANPYMAAERGYVDDVIDPRDTRKMLVPVARDAAHEARAAAAAQARQRAAVMHWSVRPPRDHARRDAGGGRGDRRRHRGVAAGAGRGGDRDDTLHEWVHAAAAAVRTAPVCSAGRGACPGASAAAAAPDASPT